MTTTTTKIETNVSLESKAFKRMFNAVKAKSLSTLSNGVKTFVRMYGNQAANAEMLAEKVLSKECTKAQIKAFTEICRDKNLIYRICKQCLPNIDGIFIEFATQETYYKQLDYSDIKSEKWIKEKPVRGDIYKPFGFNSETKKLDGKPIYTVVDNEEYKRVSVSIEISKYHDTKIAKCIAAYLALSDAEKTKI